jgi:hypothetical protein
VKLIRRLDKRNYNWDHSSIKIKVTGVVTILELKSELKQLTLSFKYEPKRKSKRNTKISVVPMEHKKRQVTTPSKLMKSTKLTQMEISKSFIEPKIPQELSP